MPQPEQWARIRARPFSPLRRGAWYRVVESTPTEVILIVNRRPLSVPKAFVQVLPIRPRMWSVVPRPRGSVSPPQGWGVRYGVCPHCAARAPLSDRATSLRCPACQMAFVIGWSDAHWRVFDLLSRSPTVQVIVKARDAALRVLKG